MVIFDYIDTPRSMLRYRFFWLVKGSDVVAKRVGLESQLRDF